MIRLFKFLVILSSLALSACSFSHLDRVPESYTKTEVAEKNYVDVTEPPRLQIIITRNLLYSSHSLVRLLYGDKLLMWDPAGSYGDLSQNKDFYAEYPLPEKHKKIRELVVDGAPSLPYYFKFGQYTVDNGMEVFEWILSEQDAKRYYDILTQGATKENNEYDFVTDHPFLLCSSYLTRFLVRFTGSTFKLNETYFFPDSLAHDLFEQHPDRIIFFDKDKPVNIFLRPK